ncbi:hypothetical protein PENTCL1PPCAC_25353, partial [Pristionchus entomophagus]
MNSTELSVGFQSIVVWANHISGAVLFAVNGLVCMLTVVDSDPRGRTYRKYLLNLQILSTLADMFACSCSPFLQFNCIIIYADEGITSVVGLTVALMVYLTLYTQMVVAYFFCIFFRRNIILPHGSGYIF